MKLLSLYERAQFDEEICCGVFFENSSACLGMWVKEMLW